MEKYVELTSGGVEEHIPTQMGGLTAMKAERRDVEAQKSHNGGLNSEGRKKLP